MKLQTCAYLTSEDLGRLATTRPNGTLQASRVGFTCNIALGIISYGLAAGDLDVEPHQIKPHKRNLQ
ncbi:hypothetical protein [Williamsia soli]|uniref:hypothetical protein n=1 Tax=Williamsia soli TaxID=364929 RepID=UPI001A9F195C|nr:hypothetical protein [Williamsia soli]